MWQQLFAFVNNVSRVEVARFYLFKYNFLEFSQWYAYLKSSNIETFRLIIVLLTYLLLQPIDFENNFDYNA